MAADFDALTGKLNNRGRWGTDDQRGTLNLITEAKRGEAAACVVQGTAFSLAIPLSWHGPQEGPGIMRINPIRTMTAINVPLGADPRAACYNDDIATLPIQAATHWDALSHTSHQGLMYNGIPADAVTYAGATKLGIDNFGEVVSRGVLLDLPRHLGLTRLPADFEITADVLEGCESAQGVEVRPGDILLIRTGHIQVFLAGDIHGYHRPAPGVGLSAPSYFHQRQISAVASDTIAFETFPSALPEVGIPVHVLCLVGLGLPLGENWMLEDLAVACSSDGRYDFLLEATPEPFAYSTGGLVNPVAIR